MANQLTDEMKQLIGRVRFCNVATASRDAAPNVSPKGSIMWLDNETIAFCDFWSPHTRENLKANTKVAVSVVDPDGKQYIQFKGTAQLLSSGDLYRKVADPALAKAKKGGRELPDPELVAVIRIEEIFTWPPTQ